MNQSVQEYWEYSAVQMSLNMGNIIKIPGWFDLISEDSFTLRGALGRLLELDLFKCLQYSTCYAFTPRPRIAPELMPAHCQPALFSPCMQANYQIANCEQLLVLPSCSN